MQMLVNAYQLRDFKKNFNSKLRKKMSNHEKFKTLKEELNEHLSLFEKDLTVFPNLKIFMEGYSLCFSYNEISGQPITIRLIWKIIEVNEEKIEKLNVDFCKSILAPVYPNITITPEFTHANFGLYYPDEQNIIISKQFIEQNDWKLVKSVIKHEILHHYCVVKGIPANDTDEEFIKLLIKYKAFISLEENAQKAYKEVLNKLVLGSIKNSSNIQQTFQLGS